MSDFQRYAVYHLPDDAGLSAFGANWLGWDVATGAPVPQYDVDGIAGITATPRKYGFHGTLKPPFRLADGHTAEALQDAIAAFAAKTTPFSVDGLKIAQLGRFLALVPDGDTAELARFAFACVTTFDDFRRPAGEAEIARRRAAGLTPYQDEMLLRWGYPFVSDAFRFHLTLSGKLGAEDLARAALDAESLLPVLPTPYRFESVCLAGERPDGMFELIHRYALIG